MRWSTRVRWRRRSLASCAGARRPSTWSTKGLHCHAALLPLRSTAAGKAGLHAPRRGAHRHGAYHAPHTCIRAEHGASPFRVARPRSAESAGAAFALFHSLARQSAARLGRKAAVESGNIPLQKFCLRVCSVFRTGSGSRKLTHVPLPPRRPLGDNQPPISAGG